MASLLRDSSAKMSSSLLGRACVSGSRSFSSSAASLSSVLTKTPEAPDSVDIPRPLQPFYPWKPDVKGVLPAAREIFPRRRVDKPTESYLADVTRSPAKEKKVHPNHPHYELVEWKRKMAESRKQNLREGLTTLHRRKLVAEAKMNKRSAEKIMQREEILRQPPRDDERLTSISKVNGVLEMLSRAPWENPDGEKLLAKAKKRVAKRENRKLKHRLDAIHTLYMNARHFITTEKQLNEAIERVFPEGDNPDWSTDSRSGLNIWNLGPPPTIEQMVRERLNEHGMAPHRLVQERTKKIAEELSGGKI